MFRMCMLMTAHEKGLLEKIPIELTRKLTIEEQDSILMGLLETRGEN